MTQPVLLKSNFTIIIAAALHSVMPWVVAMGSFFLIEWAWKWMPLASTSATVLIAVLSLLLILPPRDPGDQLTAHDLPIATSVIAKWLLLIAALVALRLFTDSLNSLPRRVLFV